MSTVGDLGRRVGERRHELGLTIQVVAARAGMNPSFVESLEQSPSPQLSRAALLRLANALQTTVEVLSGGGGLEPPGQTTPTAPPILDILDRETCLTLINAGGIGRVVFHEPRGPTALPVNFRMLDEDVVFRTSPSASLMQSIGDGQVSFEVDHVDDALGEGWSVLITGGARVVSDPTEREASKATGVAPWAGGSRDVYVRIPTMEMTGRRIRRP